MAGPNPVAINIVVNAGSAQEAIAKMRAEIAKLDGAGTAAARGAEAANKGLGGLKEQMGKSRETAMFFTQALGEFGPQGRTAQIAISGIAGAFIGGGGLIAVLGLAQAAVRVFTSRQEELRKEAEKAHDALKSMADEAARIGTTSQRSAVAAAQMLTLRRRQTELETEIGKARADDDEKLITKLEDEKRQLTIDIENTRAHINWMRVQEDAADAAAKKAKAAAEEEKRKAAAKLWEAQQPRTAEVPGGTSVASELQDITQRVSDFKTVYGGEMSPIQMMADDLYAATQQADAFQAGLANLGLELQGMASGAFSDFARSAAGAFRPVLTQSAAFSRAMRAAGGAAGETADLSGEAFAAMAQDALAGLAVEAAGQSLMETARGLAALAMGNPAASLHFASAAAFAGVSGLAGSAAYAIGQNRGMTAAERAQVEGARESNQGGGGGSFSSGSRDAAIQRTTVMVIAHPFMTESEAAKYAARTLDYADTLDLRRREA